MDRTHSEELAANLIGERLGVCPSVLDVRFDGAAPEYIQFKLRNAREVCIEYNCSPSEYYCFERAEVGYPEPLPAITVVDPYEFHNIHRMLCNCVTASRIAEDHYQCHGRCGFVRVYDCEEFEFGIIPAEAMHAAQLPNSLYGRIRALMCEKDRMLHFIDYAMSTEHTWLTKEAQALSDEYREDCEAIFALQDM